MRRGQLVGLWVTASMADTLGRRGLVEDRGLLAKPFVVRGLGCTGVRWRAGWQRGVWPAVLGGSRRGAGACGRRAAAPAREGLLGLRRAEGLLGLWRQRGCWGSGWLRGCWGFGGLRGCWEG